MVCFSFQLAVCSFDFYFGNGTYSLDNAQKKTGNTVLRNGLLFRFAVFQFAAAKQFAVLFLTWYWIENNTV